MFLIFQVMVVLSLLGAVYLLIEIRMAMTMGITAVQVATNQLEYMQKQLGEIVRIQQVLEQIDYQYIRKVDDWPEN